MYVAHLSIDRLCEMTGVFLIGSINQVWIITYVYG